MEVDLEILWQVWDENCLYVRHLSHHQVSPHCIPGHRDSVL
jgi:hypothetical protein